MVNYTVFVSYFDIFIWFCIFFLAIWKSDSRIDVHECKEGGSTFGRETKY